MFEGKTLVVAICAHRSGSSLATNVLHDLGMSLGPFELLEASAFNKYGHFEARPFCDLNRQLQEQIHGFPDDMPPRHEQVRSFCQTGGRWHCDLSYIDDELIERGRHLVEQLLESGPVSGFKDPRVALVWPFWRHIFSFFPAVRVIPLFLARSPHEIAMSIFSRSKGDHSYLDALDVVAVHLSQMNAIWQEWKGEWAFVRFEDAHLREDLLRATGICGLTWRDEVLERIYDVGCRHFEPAIVAHAAQEQHNRLCRTPTEPPSNEIAARLQSDSARRENTLRERIRQAQAAQAEQARLHQAVLDETRVHLACTQQQLVELGQLRQQAAQAEMNARQTAEELIFAKKQLIGREHEILTLVVQRQQEAASYLARLDQAHQETHAAHARLCELVGETERLRMDVAAAATHRAKLDAELKDYRARLAAIESSRYWRLRRVLTALPGARQLWATARWCLPRRTRPAAAAP